MADIVPAPSVDPCKLANTMKWMVFASVALPFGAVIGLTLWLYAGGQLADIGSQADVSSLMENAVLDRVRHSLAAWDRWSVASKVMACALGGAISSLGVAIASRKLDEPTHYAASAVFAAFAFTYGVLQPYEEYKQFRAAYTHLETAYFTYVTSSSSPNRANALIQANATARSFLKENWAAPTVDKNDGAKH